MELNGQGTPYLRLKASLLQPKDALGRAHSLWLAADHLLWVRTGYFTQSASRIDYGDIEAVILRRTATYGWTNLLAAIPCLIGVCLIAAGSSTWAIFGACLLVPCLLILLINVLLGPTCECHLQTRVGSRTIHALCRERYAARALPVLRERVLAAQADLPAVAESLAQAPAAAPRPGPETDVRLAPARHGLHALSFALLGLQALALLAVIRFTSLTTLLLCLMCAMVLAAISLLTAGIQHRIPVATRLRVVTWVAAIATLCGWAVAYVVFWIGVFERGLVKDGFSMENQLDRMALRYGRHLVENGLPDWLRVGLLVTAMGAALLALLGFAVFLTVPPVSATANAPRRPAPPPPSEGP